MMPNNPQIYNSREAKIAFGPFDKNSLRLTAAELRLPVSYISIHATPVPYRSSNSKRLLIWRIVCVYAEDCRVPFKCISFEVRREFKRSFDSTPQPVPNVHLFSEITPVLKCSVDTANFWWPKDTIKTFYGWRPCFIDIIDFLEMPVNRYEKLLINGDTLEGTYMWVRTLIGVLEEKRFLAGTEMPKIPHQPGSTEEAVVEEKVTVVADFEWWSQVWLEALASDYYWV